MTGMDWEEMKRIAYGPLNLMPEQFWSLTYKEFLELVEGYKYRNELEWRKIAQLASWIMAPHLKRPISADKLLGKDKKKKRTTPEETTRVLDDLMSEFGR